MKKLFFILAGFVIASIYMAQGPGPTDLWGAVYNLVLPTYTDRQTAIWQVDVNGKVRMSGLTPAVPCGVGAVDLTVSCTLTVSLGLGP